MLTKEREQKIVSLCQDLIRAKSLSGEEGQAMLVAQKACDELGFDEFYIDEVGNTVAVIKGSKAGVKILIDGHIDTVAVTDEDDWTMKPFGGDIKDGKVYGRGASDMKGQMAAYMCAASYFAEDTNRDFAGEIYLCMGVFEEPFEGVAARYVSERVKPDFVIIAEPSSLNLKIGQKGRAEIMIETFGKAAHSSSPDKGVNAVYHMSKVIEAISKLPTPNSDILGDGICELTDIISSPYPGASVVPQYCKVTYDRRLLPAETKQSVLEPIQEVLNTLSKEIANFDAKVSYVYAKDKCYTGNTIESERFFPSWYFSKDNPLIVKAYEGLKRSGLEPDISCHYFCTNGSHYGGEAGITCIGFGPSKETLAHVRDEYIEIEQLYLGAKGYYHILKELLSV